MDAAKWKADFRYDNRKKKILLAPTFEMTKRFYDGFAAVRVDGKWGYINERFDIVIEPQFKLAGRFHNGLAQVLRGNKTGVIGRDGRFIVEPQFAAAVPITDSVFIAIPGDRKPNIRRGEDTLESDHIGGYGWSLDNAQLYHIKKGPLTKPNLTFKVFDENNTQLIWAKTSDVNARWGLMRANGKWKIKPKYQSVTKVHMERAVVSTSKDNFGALDEAGRVVIPLKFGSIIGWREGWGEYSRVHKGKKIGALDRDGTLIGGRYFDDYEIPHDTTQATHLLENGNWLSIREDGTLGPDVGYTGYTCNNGLKMIRHAKTLSYLAPNGDLVEGGPFDESYESTKVCEGPIWVHRDEKQGYLMLNGKLMQGGLIFDSLHDFKNGLAFVEVDKKWGIIKVSGDYHISPKYDSFESVGRSVFKVTIGDKVSYILRDGTLTSRPDMQLKPEEKTKVRAQFIACRGETSLFRKNGKWGLKSKDGTTLVQPEHDLMSCYKNGIAWVPNEDQKAWCPIDRFAKRVEDLECKPTYYPYFITHHFPEPIDPNPYKSSVMWTRAYYEYGAGLREKPPRMIPDRYYGYSAKQIAKIPTSELDARTHSGYRN